MVVRGQNAIKLPIALAHYAGDRVGGVPDGTVPLSRPNTVCFGTCEPWDGLVYDIQHFPRCGGGRLNVWIKAIRVFIIATVVGLYTAFVLMKLWNWFVVGTLNVPIIGYWQMFGINMLVRMLVDHDTTMEDERWSQCIEMVYAAIPSENRPHIDARMTTYNEEVWGKLRWMILGQVFANTITLLIGAVVHALAD
jgi:hypothetical protein